MKRTKLKLISIIRSPWILPIIALASAVRLFNLLKAAIWHDEGFSLMLSARGPASIWAGSARDVHPPLYYELLHFWRNLFGDSPFAVRSLSAFAGIAVVILGVWLVRIIASRRAAILAGIFMSIMPILVRYSQEARMYGILGVFLLGATIALVYWVQNPKKYKYLIYYAVLMAAGFYTHYFTALCVAAHWLYVILLWNRKENWKHQLVVSKEWLLANVSIVVLIAPWLPNLYAQFTRGQGVGWIPKATLYTLPSSVWQFFTFTDGRALNIALYILLPLALLASAVYIVRKDHGDYKFNWLITIYALLPIIATLVVSIKKPLYIDRYLVFAATAIPMMIAIAIDDIARKRKDIGLCLMVVVVIVELIGLRNVYAQATHRMDDIAAFVNGNATQTDVIISGELYTYFDFSYYNKTGITPLLYTPPNQDGSSGRPNGYGESGLLYQSADKLYVDSYRLIAPGSIIWLIGKTGDHSYYDQVPYYWQLITTRTAGYSELRMYRN